MNLQEVYQTYGLGTKIATEASRLEPSNVMKIIGVDSDGVYTLESTTGSRVRIHYTNSIKSYMVQIGNLWIGVRYVVTDGFYSHMTGTLISAVNGFGILQRINNGQEQLIAVREEHLKESPIIQYAKVKPSMVFHAASQPRVFYLVTENGTIGLNSGRKASFRPEDEVNLVNVNLNQIIRSNLNSIQEENFG